MRCIPLLPRARVRLKSGMAGINSLLVDSQDIGGIPIFEMSDDDGDLVPPFCLYSAASIASLSESGWAMRSTISFGQTCQKRSRQRSQSRNMVSDHLLSVAS